MKSFYLAAASKIVGPLRRCRYCRRRGQTLLENRSGTWLVWRCRWCGDDVRHARPINRPKQPGHDIWPAPDEWRELSALVKRHGHGIYEVVAKCWPDREREDLPQGERFYRELLTRLRQLDAASGRPTV